MSEKICISGGALGADLAWAEEAKKHGYTAVHYSFPGHKTQAPESEVVRLDQPKLRLSNPYLAETAKRIKRYWPPNHDYTKKLLQRNFWQVRSTLAVYAISSIDEKGIVAGGTAWAVHTFTHIRLSPRSLECYVFDQAKSAWFRWNGDGWTQIEKPPHPPEVFTGIGSRELQPNGLAAISDVFLI